MTRYLSFDIGRKHTGVAFADTNVAIPLPLDTIHHEGQEVLVSAASIIATERDVEAFVVGLPLLPGGKEGEQAQFVRATAQKLCEACPWCELHFVDERETNRTFHAEKATDSHAQAATTLLGVFLERTAKERR